MKKKIYHFSGKNDLQIYPELGKFLEYFECIESTGLTAEEVLQKKYDIIELADGDFESFMPTVTAVNWKVSHLQTADTLIHSGKIYLPSNIVADCIMQTLKTKFMLLDTGASAVVVGDDSFALSVAAKLGLAGFSDIYIALKNEKSFFAIEKKLKEFIFNLKLNFVKLNELTQVQSSSSLLVSNLSEKTNAEAYESLTYFNFLAHSAIFVDMNSLKNSSLIEEAKRAELNVIEEIEVLNLKYETLLDLSKNSP